MSLRVNFVFIYPDFFLKLKKAVQPGECNYGLAQ
jgi:hypothetical protein